MFVLLKNALQRYENIFDVDGFFIMLMSKKISYDFLWIFEKIAALNEGNSVEILTGCYVRAFGIERRKG